MEISCRKSAPKASPRSQQPKIAIACKVFFKNKDIVKEDYQKALKN